MLKQYKALDVQRKQNSNDKTSTLVLRLCHWENSHNGTLVYAKLTLLFLISSRMVGQGVVLLGAS